MKRTILWILFAVFILYFGCRTTKDPHHNAVFNKKAPIIIYDTIYEYDNGYDIATEIRAKWHQPKFIGVETGFAIEKDSVDKH